MYPFQVEYWDKENGASIPYSILRVGNKVFASDQTSFDGAIRQLNANRAEWDRIPGPAGLGGVLAEGPHGTLFAATRYYLAQFSPRQGMLSHVVVADYDAGFSLARASEQELWLGGKGISRVAVHGKELRLSPEAVPNDGVPDMKYDAIRHTLWACDGSTLLYRRDGRWGSITPKDGLLDRGCSTVAIEGNGDLWMGYTSAAFSWIHDPASGHPTVRNYTQWLNNIVGNVIVANDSIHFLSPDQRGWLWRANDALYLAAPEAAKAGEWLRLDERDGLSPPTPRAFEKDMDGSVWFGTSLGIVHFSPPDDFATRFPSPPIFVAGFSVGNSVPRMADAIGRIPHGVDVVAHIGSLQFDRRNALRVRYRLLPGQAGWTNAPGLDLRLGKLRWGRHTLQVQAQLASGPWSSVSEQAFTVLAPVWLSWPALLLMAVGGASLGFGSAQWRKQQRFKREAVLPDMTAWRMGALSPETEDLIGTVLDGRYEIGHILSVGGFATVARARDLQDGGKLRAVKIFRHELADQDWVRHRFEQEVSALERLSHPNIVKIAGHGTVDSRAPYLVMEFIQGRSLRELLEQGALPREQTARFLGQLTSALAALHQATIYHRDLKPENLMVRANADNEQEIVLIDFSIALVKSPEQTFHGISRVAGTLNYMAPEQITGYADASTDIYSLAKVIVEMLTGLRWNQLLPEATLDLPEQLRSYFAENPGTLGEESVDLIVAALAFDPARRPKDVARFAAPIIRDLERGL
jgi:tRNA A-37 threonylcarbamoyl transferase component Bud32